MSDSLKSLSIHIYTHTHDINTHTWANAHTLMHISNNTCSVYYSLTNFFMQPDPEVVLPWSTRKDGSRTVDDILNENTTCIFSGCYEKSNFFGRRIQAVNCTLPGNEDSHAITYISELARALEWRWCWG